MRKCVSCGRDTWKPDCLGLCSKCRIKKEVLKRRIVRTRAYKDYKPDLDSFSVRGLEETLECYQKFEVV